MKDYEYRIGDKLVITKNTKVYNSFELGEVVEICYLEPDSYTGSLPIQALSKTGRKGWLQTWVCAPAGGNSIRFKRKRNA